MEEEEIYHQEDLKMSAETDIDIVYLTETTDISKGESLKIVQSIVSFYRTSCDPFSANQRFQILYKTDNKFLLSKMFNFIQLLSFEVNVWIY